MVKTPECEPFHENTLQRKVPQTGIQRNQVPPYQSTPSPGRSGSCEVRTWTPKPVSPGRNGHKWQSGAYSHTYYLVSSLQIEPLALSLVNNYHLGGIRMVNPHRFVFWPIHALRDSWICGTWPCKSEGCWLMRFAKHEEPWREVLFQPPLETTPVSPTVRISSVQFRSSSKISNLIWNTRHGQTRTFS